MLLQDWADVDATASGSMSLTADPGLWPIVASRPMADPLTQYLTNMTSCTAVHVPCIKDTKTVHVAWQP